MLDTPKHGWSALEIENFFMPCSYLEDPVLDVAEMFKNAIETGYGEAFFDAEGSDYILYYQDGEFYVIVNEAERTDFPDTTLESLLKEFLMDVKLCFKEWVDWFGYGPDEDVTELRDSRRTEILNALAPLEEWLKERKTQSLEQ